MPLGCAIVVFVYYNWAGLRKHGPLGYGKHFLGPTLALSPLMVVIEMVSHLARLLSLTVRLWVNMMVSELLYVMFLGLTLACSRLPAMPTPAGLRAGAGAAALRRFSSSCTFSWHSFRRSSSRFCRSSISAGRWLKGIRFIVASWHDPLSRVSPAARGCREPPPSGHFITKEKQKR